MKILVTGSSGFLGSWACRVLSEKFQVIALTRENSDLFRLKNINNIEIIKSPLNLWASKINAIKPDVVLLLHWEGVRNESRNFESQFQNYIQFESLIKELTKINVPKIIAFGSQAELGQVKEEISDKQKDNATTNYGKAKIKCRKIGFKLTENTNSKFTI